MFTIVKKDTHTKARVGILETPHGIVETPAYVIVGTHAKVKTLSSEDLASVSTQLIIVNTYHLWLKLGDEGLKNYPGLHREMRWQKPLMTDSGGFQVFSLGFGREHDMGKIFHGKSKPDASPTKNLTIVTEDGVYFREQGKELYLDAEKSIKIQQCLGADIVFAFDEPSSPLHGFAYTKEAMERTHRWAEHSLKARTSNQMLYGIVQGGAFEELRRKSALYIGRMDFDGIGIGGAFGSSFGDTKEDSYRKFSWVSSLLPEGKPRHLLGLGKIEDIFAGVENGMDTFDCVIPTREGRHGNLWTKEQRIDIKRGVYRDDESVLDHRCACPVCSKERISKKELHHLFKEKDEKAGRYATLHNVFFFNDIMEKIRNAIKEGTFAELKKEYTGK